MHAWTSPSLPDLPGVGDPVHVHDTLAGALAPTRRGGEPATLYVCGITPYDATHLGHANTYVGFDLLVRAWRDAGREVQYVQNVTDIDDPLLERAAQTGQDWHELAQSQIELYRTDMAALRVLAPTHLVGAVEAIPLVVDAVEQMLAEGHAYRVDLPAGAGGNEPGLGDVYANVTDDSLFGTGVGMSWDDMLKVFAENGGDPDRAGKHNPLDPLLWRRTRPGEPDWDGATLGRGRPGWHIECACIAMEHLTGVVEVQGGGRDLVFPHHEMSESHLRVLTEQPAPVMLHVHGGMVGYHGEKMSKSRGNLVLVSELLAQGTDPMAVRLVLLGHHFREDWEYTDADLTEATARLSRWRTAMHQAQGPEAQTLLTRVRAAMADDLDALAAVQAVDEWVDAALAGAGAGSSEMSQAAPELARRVVDALLGVAV
ncbi:cysteine--1-D-myo-inosityl 2-amino-2-deoxy-alpha-D-glucopyranoside ligase [Georgenia yuyongxinii]|uniref:L-cysteine:1D-myo-inositol 2-amino-2-deoxy-alpha-D-glucopyranoside ligase n=1 Tax=Georgenia yuyongxinii TaxID=2589797 RepID=A0A5B8C157_9MICO|nr:cysteine--1-D-myo-inosityl 2-amino-2-deoxy-alpha-D-glucopyranoside ligase [Georgenia yuyongxinii]QDC24469.1 cysteine--1-D-myo-inosityl 2-amino-2-deoxy-alpha-D-glucopyranoside ligase [Georgenia yuyongxinii]